ncbi:superinfection immunity protein [Streptomyces sp. NPDC001373]|uniref:superinfection immunity protein n=1 Tax=Streptomyces sp. NPDC001373 TaxID=3364565 RepID=UPI0036999F6E
MSLGDALPIALVALVLYFVPTVVALGRTVPNRGSVIVVNIFLGWTLIGWVVALAMAARSKAPAP